MNFIAYILKDRPLDPVVDPDGVCLLVPGVAHRGGGLCHGDEPRDSLCWPAEGTLT